MDKIRALKLRNPITLAREVGQRLKTLRLAKGWTQDELSARSGVAVSTLKLLEAKGQGSFQRLVRVAVALAAWRERSGAGGIAALRHESGRRAAQGAARHRGGFFGNPARRSRCSTRSPTGRATPQSTTCQDPSPPGSPRRMGWRNSHLSVGFDGFTAVRSMNSMIIPATSFFDDCSMPSSPGDEFTSITTGP